MGAAERAGGAALRAIRCAESDAVPAGSEPGSGQAKRRGSRLARQVQKGAPALESRPASEDGGPESHLGRVELWRRVAQAQVGLYVCVIKL